MGSDSYRVQVLHYLNPHVLWVEVLNRDAKDKFTFEEIGIYGVLPMVTTIDMEKGAMEMVLSEEWAPAATIVMKNLLLEAAQVWFCPTHNFQSSIFDNNTHKYGELVVQKADGKTIRVLNELIESQFAKYDRSLFHQRLESGKIHKKLNITNALKIYKQLEACSEMLDRPKNLWIKSLKDQTSLLHAAVNLETKIDARKLDLYNRGKVNTLLENKLKDLELCKDYDETSIGRANTRNKEPATSGLTSALLMKRLQIANTCKDTSFSDVSSSSSIIMNKYFDEFSKSENTEHILDINKNQEQHSSNNNDSREKEANALGNDDISKTRVNIDSNKHSEVDNKYIAEVIGGRRPYAGGNKSQKKQIRQNAEWWDTECEYMRYQRKLAEKVYGKNMTTENFSAYEKIAAEARKLFRSKKMEAKKSSTVARVAYGPPGVDPSKLESKVVPINLPEDVAEQSKSTKDHTNENGNTSSSDELMKTTSSSSLASASNTTTKATKLSSSLLRRKLELANKAKEISITGDDLMTNTKNHFDDSDDESISELVEKLNLSISDDTTGTEAIEMTSVDKTQINVNPFKNIDGSHSVFVDKLVSPILMVHTKKDNRIQPSCVMRDIPFGSEIHVALKNMAVNKPMRLQTVSWQTILRGRSLFLISPLGSGKTLGYLPAVCRLVADNKRDSSGPSCIIVCATSKSVSDVEMISKMCLHNARVFACYAGIPEINVTTSLLNGCDLLICTPCMLVRLLQKDFGVDLRNLSTFVLDDCERLSEVYMNEVKFSLLKIKEMLRGRANKEWQVQHVVVSRVWCDFMKRLALNAPDSVICIGAFQECVLYSQCSTTINFVQPNNKLNTVINFLKDIDKSKKTVIACRSDEEVNVIGKALTKLNYIVFACDSSMTVTDLYDLRVALSDFKEPVLGPVLVCCDGNLTHLNVTNAHYLIHYSLPELFSMFCKRFSVLVDNFSNLFKNDNDNIKIKILLEDTNIEQLPKIINFVKRCTKEIPSPLDEVCHKVLLEKDLNRAQKLVPLCANLLTLGKCPDIWNCKERHNIFREYDDPKDWMPINGTVTFQILHYHTAVTYSARLMANFTNDGVKKYPQSYSLLSLKLGMYFSKEKNKKLHGTPAVGDICAVALRQNLFARCQVIKILKYVRGSPHILLIKLIDEEKYETTRDIYLYHLPEDLKAFETYVVHIVLSNLQPVDRDVTFSDLARSRLKKITDNDADLYMRGRISLVIGNNIFVDTLEACQDLSSISEIVVKSDFRKELLDGHAVDNEHHITSLVDIMNKPRIDEKRTALSDDIKHTNLLPKGTWASLESDDFEPVFLSHAESPAKFFLRKANFSECMTILMDKIKVYVDETRESIDNINIGDIVLAECPDDGLYERARIEEVLKDKARCFFVDQGDWKEIDIKVLKPITKDILTELPFQAIECRLFGVKSASNDWTEFSTHWFVDNCYVFDNDPKYLYAKYFDTENAEHTEGLKYSVVLIDTYSKNDVIVNQLMIDLNLASENNESHILNNISFDKPTLVPPNNISYAHVDNEMQLNIINNQEKNIDVESDTGNESNSTSEIPLKNTYLQQPIRSVPLVDSDDSDDDRWNVNMAEDFMPLFRAMSGTDSKIPNVTNGVTITEVPEKLNSSLDSDDLSVCEDSDLKVEKADSENDVLRKPKLCWRQDKTTVTIKIQLAAVSNYEMSIREKHIKFFAVVDDAKYSFELELFGGINCSKSSHCNKGQYIWVSLSKLMQRKWLNLTKDSDLIKWIVYDMDALDMSSDEESVNDEHLKNIIKTEREIDSDTDDDFMDDVSYRPRDY